MSHVKAFGPFLKHFAREAGIAIAITLGLIIGGAALVFSVAAIAAGAASAATIDFAPLGSFAWDLVSPILPPILLCLLLALADKFPIIKALIHALDAGRLDKYIAVAIQGGAARFAPVASQYSKIELQNEVAAEAAAWLIAQTPQRLARLGITPEALIDRVLPYVPGHEAYKELVDAPAKAA